jgi:PAS domain S-box-containing protein
MDLTSSARDEAWPGPVPGGEFPVTSLQQLVDAVPDAAIVVNQKGLIAAANRRCLDVFGYVPGVLVGRTLELLIPDSSRDAHRDNVARFMREPSARRMGRPLALKAKRADGSLVDVDVSLNPIDTEGGLAVVVSVRDISKLARSTSQVRSSERQLKRLVDDVPFAVARIDSEGYIRYCNAFLCTLTGYAADRLVGANWVSLLSPPDDVTDRLWLSKLGSDRFVPRYRSQLRTRTGEIRLMEWSNTRHMDSHGNMMTVTCIGEDVTDRLQMEREREEMIAELGTVNRERLRLLTELAGAEERERRRIARELHDDTIQSMSAVSLLISTLTPLAGEETKLMTVQDILQAATHNLRRLTFDLHPAGLGHGGIVSALESTLQDLSAETGIEYRFHSGGFGGEIELSQEVCLFRICREAIANVRKHSRATELDVTLCSTDDAVMLTIRDNGVGAAHLVSDTGHLGLVTMRERAEIAGGECVVAAEPDAGVIVRCRLPRTAPPGHR